MAVHIIPFLKINNMDARDKQSIWLMIVHKYKNRAFNKSIFIETKFSSTIERFFEYYVRGCRKSEDYLSINLSQWQEFVVAVRWLVMRNINTPEENIIDFAIQLYKCNGSVYDEYVNYLKWKKKEEDSEMKRDDLRTQARELMHQKRLKQYEIKAAEERQKIINNETGRKVDMVYIMLNKATGLYKIGMSNNPKYRERTLQSQEPEIVLLNKWVGGRKVETFLHNYFNNKRVRGEWFRLEQDDILKINKLIV